jgi:hypothetical protein
VPRHIARLITRLVVYYFTYTARPVASTRRTACRVTHHRLLRLMQARRRLLRLRHVSGCLGTSCGSSRGSSSTTSTTPCVRVPRHIAQLITGLVAPLVVDYFAYAARLGASARRAARRLLLHLCRVSGCLGISCGSSRGSSSTTSTTPRVRVPRHISRLITRLVAPLVVDYFSYAVRPGASACRTARRRLLHLRRSSGCFGTSRGLSRESSSTTSPTPRVRVPRHVTRLVVENFVHAARLGASARRGSSRNSSRSSSSTTSPTPHVRVRRHVAQLVA